MTYDTYFQVHMMTEKVTRSLSLWYFPCASFEVRLKNETTQFVKSNEQYEKTSTHSKATEIEWRYSEDGQQVRISRRTGRVIPLPLEYETMTEGDNVNTEVYNGTTVINI